MIEHSKMRHNCRSQLMMTCRTTVKKLEAWLPWNYQIPLLHEQRVQRVQRMRCWQSIFCLIKCNFWIAIGLCCLYSYCISLIGVEEGLAGDFSGKGWAEVVSGPRGLCRVAQASPWVEGAGAVLVFVMGHFRLCQPGTWHQSHFFVTLNVFIIFFHNLGLYGISVKRLQS